MEAWGRAWEPGLAGPVKVFSLLGKKVTEEASTLSGPQLSGLVLNLSWICSRKHMSWATVAKATEDYKMGLWIPKRLSINNLFPLGLHHSSILKPVFLFAPFSPCSHLPSPEAFLVVAQYFPASPPWILFSVNRCPEENGQISLNTLCPILWLSSWTLLLPFLLLEWMRRHWFLPELCFYLLIPWKLLWMTSKVSFLILLIKGESWLSNCPCDFQLLKYSKDIINIWYYLKTKNVNDL